MGVTCEINFDNNPQGTYFAGQVLSGQVILKSDKLKFVTAIALDINGSADTRWTETRKGSDDKNETRVFQGHEDYMASRSYLMGSNASTAQISIDPGIRSYNFTCHIPVICPSSFEGNKGRVRYLVKVSLIRPWKFDQTYTRCFTVLKVMDLNYDSPLLRVPVQVETMKTYCCWPCRSDPLTLHLNLAQTGFVPGQSIPVGLLVTNDSHIPVDELSVKLVMQVCYYSQPVHVSTTSERFVVNKLKGEAVPRQCKKQFNYDLHVPATPPTCLNLCRIIQITYQVEVSASVKGCHQDSLLSIPVTIGSIPLSTQSQMQQPYFNASQPLNVEVLQATAPPANPDVNSPWAVDQSIPPPNYEEAVHMRLVNAVLPPEAVDIKPERPTTLDLDQTQNQRRYTPLYPVFNIPSPTAPTDLEISNAGGYDNAAAVDMDKGTWL